MSVLEAVLELSIEGCGSRICKLNKENGCSNFFIEIQSGFLDEGRKYRWKTFPDYSFDTLQESLEELSDNYGWLKFKPVWVSPDYRERILDLVQLAGKNGAYPGLLHSVKLWERFLSFAE